MRIADPHHPHVTAVMVTRDRPKLTQKALVCFRSQTYSGKFDLLIFDTGERPACTKAGNGNETWIWTTPRNTVIGAIRNEANSRAKGDIIVHWDDDDWSHPARIEEQVATLLESQAEVAGYNEMLFWRCPRGRESEASPKDRDMDDHASDTPGEAFIYRGTSLGTSLCYWRSAWERRMFSCVGQTGETLYRGEDADFILFHKTKAFSSFAYGAGAGEPRMVARIHEGNLAPHYTREQMLNHPQHWEQAPSWNSWCEKFVNL